MKANLTFITHSEKDGEDVGVDKMEDMLFGQGRK
jgi:hypothetical protein